MELGAFSISLAVNTTDDIVFYASTALPEPSTIMLICSGMGLIWWQRRRLH